MLAFLLCLQHVLFGETPNFMIEKVEHDQAREMLQMICCAENIHEELQDLIHTSKAI